MDYNRLEILLGKYWDCLTTVEEEIEIREFFRQENIPAHLKNIAELFNYYDRQQSQNALGEIFDQKMLSEVEGMYKVKKGKGIQRALMAYARVAAIGLIVVTVSYIVRDEYLNSKVNPVIEDTFEDPKVAFEETKKALLMISKSMGKGRKQTRKMSVFNDAEEKVKNNNYDL